MQRNVETKRRGGLEVDDQFKLGGLLDGEVAWLASMLGIPTVCAQAPECAYYLRLSAYFFASSRVALLE
jgi:hypothetical protein